MPVWIALLRAIGPKTHMKMSMAQFRTACAEAGLDGVRTILATGNAIIPTALPEADLRVTLESVVARHGLSNAVFLRQPQELAHVLRENPFSGAADQRPNHMLILFLNQPAEATVTSLTARYSGPERVAVSGRHVFIDYADGVGRSKLTGPVLDRWLGQPGTARNWNTIGKLVAAAQS